MIEKIAKLIDVKSIVTIALTITFVILCLNGKTLDDKFVDIFKLIIVFYFGTQAAKIADKEGNGNGQDMH